MAFRFDENTRAYPGDISIVIPVYNHARWVKDAVESALEQSVRPREVICIDDGSTDESPAILEAIAVREPSVRFSAHPNRGAHNTLNEGIAAASSGCVAILNSDDLYHPSRLERALQVMDADPGVALVASAVAFIDAGGHAIEDAWYKEAVAFHRRCGDLGLSLANGNFLFSTSNIVARRSLFDEIGGFSEMRYAHDLDFLLRVVAKVKRIVILPEKLLYYRRHRSNTISESHVKVREEWAAALANFARSAGSGPDPHRRSRSYLDRLLEIAESHRLLRQVFLALLDAR